MRPRCVDFRTGIVVGGTGIAVGAFGYGEIHGSSHGKEENREKARDG
jgi:hypothetical protein